jgi:hypothetical protein
MTQNKKSIGSLRPVYQDTEKHPRMIGKIKLQRHTLQIIVKQLMDSQLDEIDSCLAAWINRDSNGQYLTVELSPKFVSKRRSIEQLDPISELLRDEEKNATGAIRWFQDK